MGVATFCTVTVVLTAIDGVDLPVPITLIAGVEFPAVDGIVSIDVLGVGIDIPCPSVDLELDIDVLGTGLVSLLINASPDA